MHYATNANPFLLLSGGFCCTLDKHKNNQKNNSYDNHGLASVFGFEDNKFRSLRKTAKGAERSGKRRFDRNFFVRSPLQSSIFLAEQLDRFACGRFKKRDTRMQSRGAQRHIFRFHRHVEP